MTERKYQKLTDVQHVLLRPGRYLGSINDHTANTWIYSNNKMNLEEVTWNPALIKMFDEIISNSVDESKVKGSKLDTIKVDLNKLTGEISVYDNGGIPVRKHESGVYIPELIFSELRAGSNFDDDDESTLTGQNGEGSTLTNIFSTKFTVETCDGTNKFKQVHNDNMSSMTKPSIMKSTTNFTKISYTPDYDRLKCKLDIGNYAKLVKRVVDIAGCNPKLKIYINGSKIDIKSYTDYCKMYYPEVVTEESDTWQIGVGPSDNGFQHVSFVNSSATNIGGNHIEYIVYQITNKLREYFKKKHKVEVKPAEIRNHMTLFINATIINPRYSSQTKDELITEIKDFKTDFEVDDKFIAKVIKSSVIQSVLDWIQAKSNAAEMAALRKLNKDTAKNNPRRIAKFTDAANKNNRQDCILFLAEGDSASGSIQAARDPKTMGTYPLRGKPLNVNGLDPKKLVANKEFSELMIIMGLQIGVEVKSIRELNFGKIAITADADKDGFHICGLVINMINAYWPELFTMGVMHRFITPIVKVTVGKKIIPFYTDTEFDKWKETNTNKFTAKFYKGLGSSNTKDFKEYINNMDHHLIPITIEDDDDRNSIDLAFNGLRADDRKTWLDLIED